MSEAIAVGPRAGPIRRLSRGLERHSRLRLAALLAPPLSYLLVLYIGSLAFLLVSAFWHFDSDITFDSTCPQSSPSPEYKGIASLGW